MYIEQLRRLSAIPCSKPIHLPPTHFVFLEEGVFLAKMIKGPVGKENGGLGGNVGYSKFRSNAAPIKRTCFSFMYIPLYNACTYHNSRSMTFL